MQIGIGTYSFGGIESFFGLAPALPEIFKTIKSLGYDSVELLEKNLVDHTVEELKQYMEESGLKITSVHAFPTKELIDKMAAIGGQAVICAGSPFNCKEEALELAAEMDAFVDYAAEKGIKIAYHNHEHEFYFTEGKTLLEHLLDNSRIYAQLDCGWATAGGTYAPNFIRKYKNRICAIHVKENEKVIGPGPQPKSRHAEGEGGSPFGGIDPMTLSLEERKAMVEKIKASFMTGDNSRTYMQCPMGAKTSNIDWKEIKKALDEQDFDAFWVVERENFYTDHDQCLADDCKWLRENIE